MRKRGVALVFLVGFILATAIVLSVIYIDRIFPLRQAALTVNDVSISMDYLVKRSRMSRDGPMKVLHTLAMEEIVRQVATEPPYNIRVSDEDVDSLLRKQAQESDGAESHDFDEWYRRRLDETGLSERELRDVARTNLLISGTVQHLAGELATVRGHVRLEAISLQQGADSREIRRRLESGDSVEAVAGEYGSRVSALGPGGDLGWYPRGVLPRDVERLAFDELEVGQVGGPLQFDDRVVLIKVSERGQRELDEQSREMVALLAFEEWVREQYGKQEVTFHGLDNGFDMQTEAWIRSRVEQSVPQ